MLNWTEIANVGYACAFGNTVKLRRTEQRIYETGRTKTDCVPNGTHGGVK